MLSFNVIIVDDHPVVGMALRGMLEMHPAVRSIAVYESANLAAKEIFSQTEDCIVILDIGMPDISGLDFMRLLAKTSGKSVKILVYTGQKSAELEVAAIRAGAKGFVTKDVGPEAFMQAFEFITRQRSYFNDEALKTALTEFGSPSQEKLARLSAREYIIAKRIAAGETHSHIAEALFISPKTVSAHKGNIFDKLEISNIPQLIQMMQSVDSFERNDDGV